MTREDGLYDVVVVMDHNQRPRVRGAGSAIFLHVARRAGGRLQPTAGCLAFASDDWRRGRVPLGVFLVGVEGRPL
jgi:L,D-peptidoglycan transpeptidase YkuD (ErfK/YbiS/YcfS/YnhG family)